MTNKDEEKVEEIQEEKIPKGKISLQNFAIKNNVDVLTLAGFKAHLGCELKDLRSEKELEKSYEKYLKKPAFIVDEED